MNEWEKIIDDKIYWNYLVILGGSFVVLKCFFFVEENYGLYCYIFFISCFLND